MDWNFFFGFEGRINRARFWRVMLLNFVCTMIFMMVVPTIDRRQFPQCRSHMGAAA
jgi:uncharacterized membrane protein YhaH (DUF805 family)